MGTLDIQPWSIHSINRLWSHSNNSSPTDNTMKSIRSDCLERDYVSCNLTVCFRNSWSELAPRCVVYRQCASYSVPSDIVIKVRPMELTTEDSHSSVVGVDAQHAVIDGFQFSGNSNEFDRAVENKTEGFGVYTNQMFHDDQTINFATLDMHEDTTNLYVSIDEPWPLFSSVDMFLTISFLSPSTLILGDMHI